MKRPKVANLVKDTNLPKMFKIRQKFDEQYIKTEDIKNILLEKLDKGSINNKIKPGMKIAITVGSRGIANIKQITKSIVDFCYSKNAVPFIVPSMGSHGGSTPEGQLEVLSSLGITEEYLGCKILANTDVVKIGETSDGLPVYIDKEAHNADGIIINCRIKPHTAFRGEYESGIMKMMAIGLGNQHGAQVIHESGFKNMHKNVPEFGREILKKSKVLFAVATIENAYDQTSRIEVVNKDEINEKEPILLKEAFGKMPRILVDECDVLIVDKIGKNFSGDGMDPNITGTFCTPYASGGIKSQRVVVLDLSDESHGNGIGIGYSDITTSRFFNKIDLEAMYPNSITCTVLGGVRIPMIMENDLNAIQVAIQTCNEIDKTNPRVVRIPNSLNIGEILLSESYYEYAKECNDIEVLTEPEYMNFDEYGNLF